MTITAPPQLDATAGSRLAADVAGAVEAGAARIDVDLRPVTTWNDDGADQLRRCRELTDSLSDGLHFRTAPGPGSDALLTAFIALDEPEPAPEEHENSA